MLVGKGQKFTILEKKFILKFGNNDKKNLPKQIETNDKHEKLGKDVALMHQLLTLLFSIGI